MADQGEGPGPPSLILGKKRKGIVEGRKAGRASDNPAPPPPPQPKTSTLAGQVSWQATCEDSLQIDPQKTIYFQGVLASYHGYLGLIRNSLTK